MEKRHKKILSHTYTIVLNKFWNEWNVWNKYMLKPSHKRQIENRESPLRSQFVWIYLSGILHNIILLHRKWGKLNLKWKWEIKCTYIKLQYIVSQHVMMRGYLHTFLFLFGMKKKFNPLVCVLFLFHFEWMTIKEKNFTFARKKNTKNACAFSMCFYIKNCDWFRTNVNFFHRFFCHTHELFSGWKRKEGKVHGNFSLYLCGYSHFVVKHSLL